MVGTFEVIASRRLGLDKSAFDVSMRSGAVEVADIFTIVERGTVWEWVVTDATVSAEPGVSTLICQCWLVQDGAHVGEVVTTRRARSVERKRHAKALPEGFFGP